MLNFLNKEGVHMSKKDVVDKIAAECDFIKKSDADKIYDIFMEIIREALCKDGEIRLHQVGTLKVIHCKEKQCHNPQKKGEKITIPARYKVKFTASKSLAEAVNSQ